MSGADIVILIAAALAVTVLIVTKVRAGCRARRNGCEGCANCDGCASCAYRVQTDTRQTDEEKREENS